MLRVRRAGADTIPAPVRRPTVRPRRSVAWRALGWFWAGTGVLVVGAVLGLAALGPPAPPAGPDGAAAIAGTPPDRVAALAPPPWSPPPPETPTAPVPATVPEPGTPAAAPEAPAPVRRAEAPPGPALFSDTALLEPGPHGPLPRVGADGRTAIRVYGRAFDRADPRPRVAVVVGGIGLSAPLSDEALRRLPAAVALAVSPYAPRPGPIAERARARGAELLVALPLEPAGYPLNDPGDRALLTGLPLDTNLDRLDWALSRFQGYVGAVGALGAMRGERFAAVPTLIGPVQDRLRGMGLLYLDPRPGAPSPPRAWGRGVDLVLDEPGTRAEIERRLEELERLAREKGSALGLAGDPTPVLVDRLVVWAAGLEARGLVLAPASALIRRPDLAAGPEASR